MIELVEIGGFDKLNHQRVGPSQQRIPVRRRLLPECLHHGRHRGAAHRIRPQHHPVGEQFGDVVGEQPDQVGVQIAHKARQEPDAGPGPRGLHVDEHVR